MSQAEQGPKTQQDLKTAFAGESQANRKYLAFAKKADDEGFPGIAKLFRAAADAETVHALREMRMFGGVQDTAANIQTAINGETYEYTQMYAEFLDDARAEDDKQAMKIFGWIKKVEEIHANWYQQALMAAQTGNDLRTKGLWTCQECGNIVEGDPPDHCPVCAHPREFFKRID